MKIELTTNEIELEYNLAKSNNVVVSPLEVKPWGQREISILDPDKNLLTFGESI